ncbi:hypothetical protein G3480_25330 [Thiorhodococcus mannitoliphagus]|uniref:DUF4386 family protein n=1 Tax=Thiorhodococcus mannitoliphagus TaxID=329406 RepID=A0A6P1E2I6_9GAMM|nr:hypothetical protein [Thiorhodococcus mannitoliphagus]NEX23561.1 hypothetical protein [Thiorhodococcus mannitoliphagus]
MTNIQRTEAPRRLAGWVAIVGALLAWSQIGLYMAALSGDLAVVYKPAVFLSLPAPAHDLFHASLVLDTLGFYLPFLVIGGYLWSVMREEHGALIDMAALCIVTYAVMGITGDALLFASVSPLAAMHAAGDPAVKAASEAAWLALATGAQQGLWIMEGPVMGFWALVMGSAMRRSGKPYGLLLMLVGFCYAAVFVLGVLGVWSVVAQFQLVFLVLLPLWSLLTGIALLRQRAR